MDGRIFALLSAACFGINSAVLKAGLGKGESHIAVVVGLVTGFPIVWLLAPQYGGLRLSEVSAPALVYFALSGVSAVFVGRMLLYLGIERIGPARASTFKNSAPVFTAVLAWLFLGEAVTGFRWLGILAVTLGLILIGNKARRGANPLTATGLAIAMGSAIAYSLRSLFSKLGLNQAPMPLTSTFVQYVAALLLYGGFLLLTRQLGQSRPDRRSLVFFAIGGVLQTLGVLFLQMALNGSDVTVIYPISASAPLIAFVLSYTVLKNAERLTAWDLIGILLAVAGVALLLIL